tara:strand:+ start:674 stop:1168 length:495 start_codon:yes stop_codon:yes gene_type:complete
MRRQRLNSIGGLRPRTALGEDEKIVGTHTDGRPIVRRTFTQEVRHPVLDGRGEQKWKMNQLGIPTVPIFELRPETATEEYVYDELKTGHNHRNYHFRPDAEELERTAKRRRVSALQEEFFEAAEDRGLTADQIADFVAAGRKKVEAVEELVAPRKPKQRKAATA